MNVPGMEIESLNVVSVTTRSVNASVIGGVQDGLTVTVYVNEPVAWPLLTLKVPPTRKPDLFAAFGCFEPGLMHSRGA